MDIIQRRAVAWLVFIGLYHTVLIIGAGYLLYINGFFGSLVSTDVAAPQVLWVNTSLIGFMGSLLYFSRKAYVYLIANKIFKIEAEIDAEIEQDKARASSTEKSKEARYRARLAGYYVYLVTRPLGGFAIGPIVTMLILGGLTTLSKTPSLNSSNLSQAGLYVIYLFSFIGGYTSSDLFDYLSRAGARLLNKQAR